MMPIKQVEFYHNDQYYFISPSTANQTNEPPYPELLALLESHGIQPVYHVEEDVKGRYLTILVNKSLEVLKGHALPDGIEFNQSAKEPYLYLIRWVALVVYDKDWLAVVDGVWKANSI